MSGPTAAPKATNVRVEPMAWPNAELMPITYSFAMHSNPLPVEHRLGRITRTPIGSGNLRLEVRRPRSVAPQVGQPSALRLRCTLLVAQRMETRIWGEVARRDAASG